MSTVTLTAGLTLPGAVGVASAHHGTASSMCGWTVPGGTVLQLSHNVTGCTGTAFFVGAGATLDLNGYSISAAAGNTSSGVRVQGDFATVTNSQHPTGGIIEDFGAGVEIRNRYFALVSNLTVQDNNTGGSSASAPGEGIALWNTIGSVVENNKVLRNGPYAGIGVYGTSSGNEILTNVVQDNSKDRLVLGSNPARYTTETIGIRLDFQTSNTRVEGNTVSGSGLDGISSFQASTGNTILNNTVSANGFHTSGHRPGDGIRINSGSTSNQVEGNTVSNNAGHGISSFGTGNVFTNNHSSGHGSGPYWDLYEAPPCDNVWTGNTGTRNDPVCIG